MRRFLKRAWLPAASFFCPGVVVALVLQGYAEVAALAVMAPPIVGLLIVLAVSASEAGEAVADRFGWFDD